MTDVTVWSTAEVSNCSRFEAWSEKMNDLHMAWDLSTPARESYEAKVRYSEIGLTRLADVSCSAFAGHHEANRSETKLVGIQLQVSGNLLCDYGNREIHLSPGDLFIWDSHRTGSFATNGHHHQISLIVPAARVPSSFAEALDSGIQLSARAGSGSLAVAARHLGGIASEMEHLDPRSMNRIVDGFLDIIDVALTPVEVEAGPRRAVLLEQVQSYILDHLGDRELSLSSIADAHWVSVRTLHLLFSDVGTTASRWIREQRLQRCYRELANATATTTITSVAYRWGFSDTAHFSRSFKKRYGVTPVSVMSQSREAPAVV